MPPLDLIPHFCNNIFNLFKQILWWMIGCESDLPFWNILKYPKRWWINFSNGHIFLWSLQFNVQRCIGNDASAICGKWFNDRWEETYMNLEEVLGPWRRDFYYVGFVALQEESIKYSHWAGQILSWSRQYICQLIMEIILFPLIERLNKETLNR